MHKLPIWLLKGALFVMFIAEIPAPLLVFHPTLGLVAFVLVVGLMLAIQLFGSFGYFSLVTAVACVALLDTETPRALHFTELFTSGAPWFTNSVVALHLLGALLAFPFNSWVGQHWQHWVFFQRAPAWLTFPIIFTGSLALSLGASLRRVPAKNPAWHSHRACHRGELGR